MVTPDIYGTLFITKPDIPQRQQLKLDTLQEYLKETGAFTTNPLRFIQIHYDGDKSLGIEEKEIEGLWEFLKDKGMDYSTPANLHRALVSMGIIFRKGHTAKGRASLQEKSQGKKDENYRKFLSALEGVHKNRNFDTNDAEWDFHQETYDTIRYPRNKALHILGIDRSDVPIIGEESGLGAQAITTSINMALAELIPQLNDEGASIEKLSLTKGSVTPWFTQ